MTLGTNLRGVSAVGERDLYARRSGSWRLVPPRVLEDLGAVFAIDAAQSIPGEQVVLNRGSGGQVLRAGYGSVRRAEIRNGVGLCLPGANGNGGLAPDSAALDITGDIDLRVRVALDNWAPSALEVIVAKNNELTSQAGYALAVNTAGQLVLYLAGSASSLTSTSSTVSTGLAPGSTKWVRATWRASDGRVQFFLSDDALSWAQLGPNASIAIASINTNSEPLTVGGNRSAAVNVMTGVVFAAQIRNGINGPVVFDVDFTTQPDLTTSFVCSTGQTVTVTAANAVDTNDPLLLPWTGENYVHFPGGFTTNSVTSSPTFTASDSLLRIEVDAEFDFATAGFKPVLTLASGANTTALAYIQEQSYVLRVTQAGPTNRFIVLPSGETGSAVRRRIAWEVNMLAGTARLFIHNGTSWIQFGTTQSFTAGAFGWPAVDSVTIGGAVVGTLNAYGASVINGGTSAFGVDFTTNTSQSSFVTGGGHTANINRNGSGRKTCVVTRPVWLFGTDDFMEVADNDLLDFGASDGFSLVVVCRQFAAPSGATLLAKAAANSVTVVDARYFMRMTPSSITTYVDDGAAISAIGNVYASGSLSVVAFTATPSTISQTLNTNMNATSRAAGNLTNSRVLRIGSLSTGTAAAMDMELLAVGVFRRALSADEIARIVTAYGAA